MKNEKAIEILKEAKRQSEVILNSPTTFYSEKDIVEGCETMRKHIEAYETAIVALGKCTAVKPIDRCMFHECPTCGNVEIQDCSCCPDCGQALDWSE